MLILLGCGFADAQFKSSDADPAVQLFIEPSNSPLPLQSISLFFVSMSVGVSKSLFIVIVLIPVQPLEPVLIIV